MSLQVENDERWVVLGAERRGQDHAAADRRAVSASDAAARSTCSASGSGRTDVRTLRERIAFRRPRSRRGSNRRMTATEVVMTARVRRAGAVVAPVHGRRSQRAAARLLERFALRGARRSPLPDAVGRRTPAGAARPHVDERARARAARRADRGPRHRRARGARRRPRRPGRATAARRRIVLVTHHLEEIPPGFTHALVLQRRPRASRQARSPTRRHERGAQRRASSWPLTPSTRRERPLHRPPQRVRPFGAESYAVRRDSSSVTSVGATLLQHDLAVDDALHDVGARRQVVHDLEQHLFEDGPQTASAGAALQRLVGDRVERVVGEDEVDVVEVEELLVLLHQRVLRLDEDAHQRVLVEVVHDADDGQPADELGNQTELQQVFGQHVGEEAPSLVVVVAAADVGAEADAAVADAGLDDLVEAGERAATDEQDVRGVDLDELLVRVLAAALGRHRRGRALEDLEQRLLHTFARHVAGDRRVLGLAGDLVDLVDVDDAGLGLLDVVVGGLDQLEEDVLDVFADVARFGERGGVGDRERHLQHARQRLREQRLAAARSAR